MAIEVVARVDPDPVDPEIIGHDDEEVLRESLARE